MATLRFLAAFRSAFQDGALLKLTLSKPTAAAAADLKNVYLRPVELKKKLQVAFTYRYRTRDEVKNHPLEAAVDKLTAMLGREFLNADLLTTTADLTLSFKKGAAVLRTKKAAHDAPPDLAHNREKERWLDPAAPWLHALGITSARGQVLPSAQDKWRQINKYLEIIDGLLRTHPLPADPRIVDMGSGKGYLTFALYDYLTKQQRLAPQITGIERRPDLVKLGNQTAQQAGFDGLRFLSQDIQDFQADRLDMLIALHACDTATDLALATGVRHQTQVIVVAPCCHQQIRRDMTPRNELAPVLKHGILEERQAEILTDGLRALLLEAEGYRTQVFEFISTEHTAKNVMITAVLGEKRERRRDEALAKVTALKEGFGIKEHYLEGLLR